MASLQLHCSLKLPTTPLLLVSRATASSSSVSVAGGRIRASGYPSIVCGRGDMRTAKGKRTRQSYGNSRPKNKSKGRGLPVTPLPQSAIKKNVESNSEEEAALELDETLLTT